MNPVNLTVLYYKATRSCINIESKTDDIYHADDLVLKIKPNN